MNFRKIDYVVAYVLCALLFIAQMFTLDLKVAAVILIVSIIPALILGTITNLIFKKRT